MTAKSAARMAKAQKIARTLLAQAPAARWLESGVAEGTPEFWTAAAEAAGTRPPSAETAELVVELIRTADGMAVPA